MFLPGLDEQEALISVLLEGIVSESHQCRGIHYKNNNNNNNDNNIVDVVGACYNPTPSTPSSHPYRSQRLDCCRYCVGPVLRSGHFAHQGLRPNSDQSTFGLR
jgi:hypothetical protein